MATPIHFALIGSNRIVRGGGRRWSPPGDTYGSLARYHAHSSLATKIAVVCLIFSLFAAVFLCGVAGTAETFPSFSVSGPFLPDVPGFKVPSDSVFPWQHQSSSRALPLHLHFDNCSDVFCFISSFDVPETFQPSPSHDHRYQFHSCFLEYVLIYPVFQQAQPVANRVTLISHL